LFLGAVETIEEWSKGYGIEPQDRRAYSAALAAIKLSVFVFRDQVSKALGEDITSPSGYARIGQGLLDVFSIPIITQEQVETIRKQEK
jgi:hypothetical protein